MTEGRRESVKKATTFAKLSNTGSQWYNNGIENKKFYSDPGLPWVAGVLYQDKEATKEARANGVREVRSGKLCYTDGKKNYYIYPNETPNPEWVKGMAPQKKRNSRNGFEVWNDGIKSYRVYEGAEPESHWNKGMLPRKALTAVAESTMIADIEFLKQND